uniref:Pacifastin domain-containing protein n=1 Tax=Panagrellus redivivus TaxID=6233 RepID=A0A7E4V9N1_PANRE
MNECVSGPGFKAFLRCNCAWCNNVSCTVGETRCGKPMVAQTMTSLTSTTTSEVTSTTSTPTTTTTQKEKKTGFLFLIAYLEP